MVKNKYCRFYVFFVFLFVFTGCKKEIFIQDKDVLDWTTSTHSNNVEPNYNVVFEQDKVHRIDLVLTKEKFDEMTNDLNLLISIDSEESPKYVAADLYYNGIQWYNVGVRYKSIGIINESKILGIRKFPLRLKFDKFENDYPNIKNQRFFGFQDLNLESNYSDKSFLREKVATDLFEEFGVPAAKSAFYEVWVDEGDGETKYYGLYTMLDVISDTLLSNVFNSNTGNAYESSRSGSQFGSFGFDLSDFEQKNNEIESGLSDLEILYNTLHSKIRISNVNKWKENLERVFDVNGFLKYLAANNTIQNWDTYGNKKGNYYLYKDPTDNLIKWIPKRNNQAFKNAETEKTPISFGMSEVDDKWSLITYLFAIPEYKIAYDNYIQEFIDGPFETFSMNTRYFNLSKLINSAVTKETKPYTFLTISSEYNSAVTSLQDHASTRNTEASEYIKLAQKENEQ